MTSRIVAGLALSLLSIQTFAQESDRTKTSNVHIGLVYPISTNGIEAARYKNKFSIHAIAGVSAAEEGACLSGAVNFIKYDGNGLVAAGCTNIILGNAKGGQFGSFVNYIRGNAEGIQGAGFANVTGRSTGVQAAGFANINTEDAEGVQVAGFMNYVNDIKGFQGAGFLNIADRVQGVQAAGFGNIAGDVKGTQVSGYFNKAGDVHSQVSGFLNIAKNVKGVQVSGFINIADSCDYPIGFINISRKGEKFIGMTVDNNLTTLVTFRSGGKYLYGIVGAGANMSYSVPVYALEGGIGAHIPLAKSFRFNTEVVVTSLSDFWNTVQFTSSVRVLPALKLGNRLEIFAGPTFNYEATDRYWIDESSRGYLWQNDDWDYRQRMYIGGIAGIQFDI